MKKELKFIDLFAGMGGLRKGFELAIEDLGYTSKCVLTSEIKPYAIEVYKQNYPGEEVQGDITKIDSSMIPDFDVLLGGFPCQAFSVAGKQLGFNDTRGTLFFEVARILKEKRPGCFVLENVEGLVKHDLEDKNKPIGRTLEVILNTLNALGYNVSWKVLDSSEFGVGQARKRIYIVGSLYKKPDLEGFEKVFVPFGDVQEYGVECVETDFSKKLFAYLRDNNLDETYLYDKAIRDKRGSSNNIHSWWLGLKGVVTKEQSDFLDKLVTERRKSCYALSKGAKAKDGLGLTIEEISTFYTAGDLISSLNDLVEKGYLKRVEFNGFEIYDIKSGKLSFEYAKILDPTKPCLTLVATDVNKIGVLDNGRLRHLTLDECLRLQGYPKGYKLDIQKNKAYDLLGNTVVVPVVKEVSKRVLDTL